MQVMIVALFMMPVPGSTQVTAPADSALRAILQLKDRTMRMDALYAASQKYTRIPDKAKPFATAFYRENQLHPTDSNSARADYLMGDIGMMSANYEEGLRYLLKALPAAEKQKMYALQIEILADISGLYLRTDDRLKSLNTIKDALAIARAQHYLPQEARMMHALGIRYAVNNRFDDAIALFDSSAILARRLHLPGLVMDILESKITAYNILENNDAALMTLKMALPLADSLGIKNTKATLLLQLGTTYLHLRRFAESRLAALQAEALSDEINDPVFNITLYDLFATLYQQTGDYKAAFTYLKKQKTLDDSVFTANKTAQLEELQTRYDTEVKDKKIAAQGAQILLNKKVNLFLWISSGLLLLIGLLIFRNQRKTRNFNIRISQQAAELQYKTMELAQMNRLKDQLFSVISHDLRTPVNSLMSFTVLLDHTDLPAEKLKKYTAVLKETLGHTTGLLDNLLHFARTQIKAHTPVLQSINIQEVTEEVLQLLQPAINTKKIVISSTIPAALTVKADTDMTALILRNLIGNAVKYSYEGAEITIKAWEQDKELFYTIRDTGTGMPQSMVSAFNNGAIQQPVSSTAGTRHEKGTGLGLMLCSTFIRQLQGRIELSAEEGKGTVFTVILPAAGTS